MSAKPSRWISLFQEFAKDARISSKEINTADDRGSPLILWESQRRFLHEVATGLDLGQHNFICLKSRQLGVTTVSLLIDCFWLAMHHNLTMALVTDTEKNRDANRMTLRRYINSFPEGYFGDDFYIIKGGDNRQFMAFSNGSRIDFLVAGTKNKGTSWGEGVGYAAAHMTEVAAYGNSDGLKSFEEAFAQNNPHRLFIKESTAKSFNHFRTDWIDAQNNPETVRSFFLGWWSGDTNRIERSDPRFLRYGLYPADADERERIAKVAALYNWKITPEQLAWARWRSESDGDTEILRQNQPWTADEAFVQSGYSFFNTRTISQDIQAVDQAVVAEDPFYFYRGYRYELGNSFFDVKLEPVSAEQREHTEIELRVWDEPVEGAKYVIGCDTAFGRNEHKDRQCISVWRCFADKLLQVAEYATSHVEPKHCAWVLAHLAGTYRDCLVNIEVNGPGRMLLQEWDTLRGMLKSELYAERVRSLEWEDALGWARWYLYHRPDSIGAGYAFGFETSWRNKQEIMYQMKGEYVTRGLILRSMPLLKEMAIVVVDGSEIGAPESRDEDSKDDRVFASALAIRTWIDWRRREMLASGESYEVVTARESGESTPMVNTMNSMVLRFFQTRQQAAEDNVEQNYAPKYMLDRGLA